MLDDGWRFGWKTVPGASSQPSTLMRINFATTQDARFWRAYEKARVG